jgi:hypothetical protein
MLRRTKSKLIESGDLFLPPLTEITVYILHPFFVDILLEHMEPVDTIYDELS